jgi:hypothetical protein
MLQSSSLPALGMNRAARLGRGGAFPAQRVARPGSSVIRRLQTPDSDQLWIPPSAARDIRPRAVPGFNQATIKVRVRMA